MESWFSNAVKNNFQEGDLPVHNSPFPRLLAQVQVPGEWANAGGELAPVNWAWELPTVSTGDDDDGDGDSKEDEDEI